MDAPVAHFSVACVPIPVPVVMQLLSIDWLITCRAEPQVVIKARRRLKRRCTLADRLAFVEPANLNILDRAERALFVKKILQLILKRIAALLRADLNDAIIFSRGTNELLPFPMIVSERLFNVDVF